MRLHLAVTAALLSPILAGRADDGLERVGASFGEPVPREGRVESVAFVGTSSALVYAVGDEVWLARAASLRGALVHKLGAPIRALAASPDARFVAVATTATSSVSIVDLTSRERVGLLPGVERALYLSWSPEGERVLSVSSWGALCVASVGSDEPILTATAMESPVVGAAFTRDGLRLVTLRQGRGVMVADALTGHVLHSLDTSWDVKRAALSQDGRRLALTGERRVLDVALHAAGRSDRPLRELASALALSSDGRICVAGESTRTFLVLGSDATPLDRHTGRVTGLAISPDGTRALSSGMDGTVRLWDAQTGEPLRRLRCGAPRGQVAFSDDGARLFVVTAEGVTILDAEGVAVVGSISGRGRALLSASGRALFTEEAALALVGTGCVATLAEDADGRPHLATVEVGTGERRVAAEPLRGRVRSVAFSRDGRRALVATPVLELWDMEALARVRVYENAPDVPSVVAVSTDGKRGAAEHEDRRLRLWDLERPWAIAAVDLGSIGGVSAIAFAPSGEWLLVGTTDGRLHRFSLPR